MNKLPERGSFAARLRAVREAAGLKQSELAHRSGLTPAYISQLESGKKPPPSDDVVEKMAVALGEDKDALLELAHFEKTPGDVRSKYSALDARLKRQSRLTGRLIEDMLPLTLFNFLRVPGYLDRALRARKTTPEGREVLGRIGSQLGSPKSFREFRRDSTGALNALGEKEREDLVETLQSLADWEAARPSAEPPGASEREIPVYASPPRKGETGGAVGALSVASRSWKPSRWVIAAADDSNHPKIEKGDFVVFDGKVLARSGDFVAASLESGGFVVGRMIKRQAEIEIAPVNPAFPPLRFPRDRNAPRGFSIRGVAVELIRTLRA